MFGVQGTGLPPLTAADEQLLERAKWLIARFQRREDEDLSQVLVDTSHRRRRRIHVIEEHSATCPLPHT